jgi:hypothetical protein
MRTGSGSEGGFVTIQYVAAIALSMLLLVLMANLLVDLYARGAVRDALDEGVRAAVPMDASIEACETRVREVLDGLVRSSLVETDARCRRDGAWVVADARVVLRSWLPTLVPDWRMDLQAEALREE